MSPFSLSCKGSSCQPAVRCIPPITIPETTPEMAHQAAEDVFRKPLTHSVETMRRQQRVLVRSKRATRAKMPTRRAPRPPKAPNRPRPRHAEQPIPLQGVQDGLLYSHVDGPAPEAYVAAPVRYADRPREAIEIEDRRFALVQGDDGPRSFAIPLRPPDRLYARNLATSSMRRTPTESENAHARPLDRAEELLSRARRQLREGQEALRAQNSAEAKNVEDATCNMPLQAESHCAHCGHCATPVVVNEKRFGMLSPPVPDTLKRSILQQSRISTLTLSESLQKSSSGPNPPSRTSSVNRAVDRFTKELELYVDHTGARGKLPAFTPTPESAMSLHTVSVLLPFQAEFQAAGLAVTSEEQRQKPKLALPAPLSLEQRAPKGSQDGGMGCLLVDGARSESPFSSTSSSSTGTQVAFAVAKKINWEALAMVDVVPPVKDRTNAGCCGISCFHRKPSEEAEETAKPKRSDKPANPTLKINVVPPSVPEALNEPESRQNRAIAHKHTAGKLPGRCFGTKTNAKVEELYDKGARVRTWPTDVDYLAPSTRRPLRPPNHELNPRIIGDKTVFKVAHQPDPENRERPVSSRTAGQKHTPEKPLEKEQTARRIEDTGTDKVTPLSTPVKDKRPIYPKHIGLGKPAGKPSLPPKEKERITGLRNPSEEHAPYAVKAFPIPEESHEGLCEPLPRAAIGQKPAPPVPPRSSLRKGTVTQTTDARKPEFLSSRYQEQHEPGEPETLSRKPLEYPQQAPPPLRLGVKKDLSGKSQGSANPSPELPFAWRYTVSNASSLERAIEAVSREMENAERATPTPTPVPKPREVDADLETRTSTAAVDLPMSKRPTTQGYSPSMSPPPSAVQQVTSLDAILPASRSSESSDGSGPIDYDDRDINDRDVLRGLHIIASAACDEEVDAFIRNKTGVRLRRFLADLKAFETLADESPPDGNGQRLRKQRAEIRRMKEQARQSRRYSSIRS
jgi:hypothetical protein